jgi:hypothetical protein
MPFVPVGKCISPVVSVTGSTPTLSLFFALWTSDSSATVVGPSLVPSLWVLQLPSVEVLSHFSSVSIAVLSVLLVLP